MVCLVVGKSEKETDMENVIAWGNVSLLLGLLEFLTV